VAVNVIVAVGASVGVAVLVAVAVGVGVGVPAVAVAVAVLVALGVLVTLAVALGVGLSARTIHRGVERNLNQVFFRKRARSLASLRRFALESEIITTPGSLLSLAYDCVRQNVESHYTAMYISAEGLYQRVFGPESAPALLGVDDAEILRLRRWSEPFSVEHGSQPFSEALMLPMTARGQLLGVLVCGPKRERTRYLHEEVDALALVAPRVGTAYEFFLLDPPSLTLQHQETPGTPWLACMATW